MPGINDKIIINSGSIRTMSDAISNELALAEFLTEEIKENKFLKEFQSFVKECEDKDEIFLKQQLDHLLWIRNLNTRMRQQLDKLLDLT